MSTKCFPLAGVLALVAAAAIAGCGGSTTPASSGAPATASGAPSNSSSATTPSSSSSGSSTSSLHACTALTQSDAATITQDQSIQSMGSTGAASEDICEYVDASSGSGAGSTVVILIEPAPGVSQSALQAAIAQAAASSGSGTYQSVSGIGDLAFSETDANDAGLGFAEGNTLVVIWAESPTISGSALLPAVETQAKAIVGQL